MSTLAVKTFLVIFMNTKVYQTVLTQRSALFVVGVYNPFCDLCEGSQGDSYWKTLSIGHSLSREHLGPLEASPSKHINNS